MNKKSHPVEEDIKLKFLPGEVDIQLMEDDDQDGESGKKKSKKAHICLIKAGWNANDYYFDDTSLDEVLQLMAGKPKLYVDHDYFGMGRSEKDWAASYLTFSKSENKLVGDIIFTGNPLTSWLYEEIERNPKEVQLSIDIRAMVEDMDTPDGRTGRKVTKVLAYRSTDFVSYAAAGGEALAIFNQIIEQRLTDISNTLNNPNKNKENKMDITLSKLKAENPEIIDALKAEFAGANKVEDLKNSVTVATAKVTELEAQIATLKAESSANKTQVETLLNEKKTVEAERDALKLKVDEAETSQKLSAWKADIANAITEAKVDEKLVTQVFLSILEKESDIAKVKEMIEDRKAIADAKFSIENGGPNNGGSDPVVITDDLLVDGIKS